MNSIHMWPMYEMFHDIYSLDFVTLINVELNALFQLSIRWISRTFLQLTRSTICRVTGHHGSPVVPVPLQDYTRFWDMFFFTRTNGCGVHCAPSCFRIFIFRLFTQ
jgi:hypothetical protein